MASEDPYYNRRLRGTRTYEMRHRIVLSIMAVGGLIGTLYHFLPTSQKISHHLLNREKKEPDFMTERRFRIQYGLMGTTDSLKEGIKTTEDPIVGDA